MILKSLLLCCIGYVFQVCKTGNFSTVKYFGDESSWPFRQKNVTFVTSFRQFVLTKHTSRTSDDMTFDITLTGHEKWFDITSSGQEKWIVTLSNLRHSQQPSPHWVCYLFASPLLPKSLDSRWTTSPFFFDMLSCVPTSIKAWLILTSWMLSAYFNQSSNSWILPAVTSSSTIKHVYLAKSEFRQDIHLIVDKLKCAFQIPGWSAMVVLPFYFASDHSSVSSLIDQYGDSVILRGGEKLLRQQELRLSESLYSEKRILRQVPA